MYAMTLSIMKPRILRDSPPFQAGVGLEMLSPGGYMPIILHVGPLSTSTARPGLCSHAGALRRRGGSRGSRGRRRTLRAKDGSFTMELERRFEESHAIEQITRKSLRNIAVAK